MIWLFCKKKTWQNKTQALNLCFLAQKKSSSCFYGANEKAKKERGEERGGASWARHKRKREGWARLGPSTPLKIHTQSAWLAAQSPGSKGERKGLFCAFRPSGAQRRICTSIRPHKHMPTHMHMHTHRLVSAWRWLWPLALCSANQKTVINPRLVSQRQGAAVET